MKDDPILGDLFDKLIEMRTGTDGDVYLYGVPEHLRKKGDVNISVNASKDGIQNKRDITHQ